jgi:hypothetical protein
MIFLPVDEGYAYDVLAICHVKYNKQLPNSDKSYFLINDELKKQLGKLHDEILHSEEYSQLIIANLETFDAVEKARYGTISAKEVDDLNMKRFLHKKNLQKKFFPNLEYMETKS